MRRLLILVGTIFLTCALHAQEMSSHEKAAENVLELANTRELMDHTLDAMLEAQIKSNPQLLPLKDAMRAFFQKHVSYESTKNDLIALYVEEFTEEELGAIADFYKTSVGQKFIRVQPDLASKGMQIGQQRVMDNKAELQMMLVNAMAEKAAADSLEAANQIEEK